MPFTNGADVVLEKAGAFRVNFPLIECPLIELTGGLY